jgi:hypothetical protein
MRLSEGAREAVSGLRAYLRGEAPDVREAEEVVAGLPAAEAVDAIEAATATLSDEARGVVAMEALPHPRDASPELLESTLRAVADSTRSPAFRVVLLDYLETAVRRGASVDGYATALAAVAAAVDEAPAVRARALRALRFADHPQLETLLTELLAGPDDNVADAAASVAADLARRGPLAPSVAAAVVARADIRLAGTLRALAALSDVPEARDALTRAAQSATEPTEVLRVINAAGDALPPPERELVAARARPSAIAAPEAVDTIALPDGRSMTIDELYAAVSSQEEG